MANQLKHPGWEELEGTIRSLYKSAWFLNATWMASKLRIPIAMNVIIAGASVGSN